MKNKVKQYRIERDLTQEELALLSNVSRPIISDLENNKKTDLKLSIMRKIAKALKQDVTEVFFLN